MCITLDISHMLMIHTRACTHGQSHTDILVHKMVDVRSILKGSLIMFTTIQLFINTLLECH